MGVRIKAKTTNAQRNAEVLDTTTTQREVTVDGYTFHFGPNEVKNFLDEGVGAAVAAFNTAVPQDATEDANPMGSSRF